MENTPLEILVFEDESGKEPFSEWLHSCDKTVRAKIFSRLDRLEQGHWGDWKSVGNKLFELRMHFGSGYRIYLGKINNTVVLLLTAGKKSTQKQDIKKANKYWKIFLRRDTK